MLCNELQKSNEFYNLGGYCIGSNRKNKFAVSRRLTIAVPESLYERLQAVKHQLNISSICQEALDMAITLRETALTVSTQEQLVQRLRLEKQNLLNQAQQKGFELGLKTSPYLNYQDFEALQKRAAKNIQLSTESLEDLWTFLDSRDYPQEQRVDEPGFIAVLNLNPHTQSAFVQGWMNGVLSVWDGIRNQVNAISEC